MTQLEGTRTDRLLREAAAGAAWPPSPDLRTAVLGRIERESLVPGAAVTPSDARTRPPGTRSRPPAFRLGRALAVALLALLVLAGVAAALGFRLPGLDILFVDRLPPAGSGLALGSPVPLADAENRDRPRVLVPAALPQPDAAFVLGVGDRRIVTLAYPALAGEPALGGSELALTVMAVPGDTEVDLLRKMVAGGTTVEPVEIGGSRGWWIAGAPHEILILRPDGSVGTLTSALAGDTLVFARDGTLYRLESALGRDTTVAIAESMR